VMEVVVQLQRTSRWIQRLFPLYPIKPHHVLI